MSLSLPAEPPAARSLTRVVPRVLDSLGDATGDLRSVRSAIVFLVDGLGKSNLHARSGHARFLTDAMGQRDTVRTVFPSTTATALTSLMTGEPAGTHGIVGYSARIPGTDVIANQLHGWERDGLDPYTWQRSEPLFVRESRAGRPTFVVSREGYRGSGFTEAIHRGAEFVAGATLAERVDRAAELARAHTGALVYLYAPELDQTGHGRGSASDAWSDALEDVDAAARHLEAAAGADTGILVTADHGMVDVCHTEHLLLGTGDPLLDGVRLIGGEPRTLHLYAEPGAESEVLRRWRESESRRSWVLSRDEAISAGLFGVVHPEVRARIGDVLVAARSRVAYYDDRLEDKTPQKMVGQHGSLTDEERIVPLIRLGGYRRS